MMTRIGTKARSILLSDALGRHKVQDLAEHFRVGPSYVSQLRSLVRKGYRDRSRKLAEAAPKPAPLPLLTDEFQSHPLTQQLALTGDLNQVLLGLTPSAAARAAAMLRARGWTRL